MYIVLNGERYQVPPELQEAANTGAALKAWIAAKCDELGCENPDEAADQSTAADRARATA